MAVSNSSILQDVVKALPESVINSFKNVLFLGKIVLLIIIIYLIIRLFSYLFGWYREHKEAQRLKKASETLDTIVVQLDNLISINKEIRDNLVKKRSSKDKDKKKEQVN